MDEAIWHMERAYEVQPANNAIQRELQRLYGKRDGIEPPKIRLTRAALARMYIKGDLYEQAINELRSTQDPITQRPDLYVLLAQVYFLSGKRVDAAQVANQLLKRLPFCFEANRILSAILTESDRADEAKGYRQRLIALDPYAAHTSPAALTPDEVPDSAVSLEKLEWNPDLTPADMLSQPEWASSLGVEIEDEEQVDESLPEWLDELDEPPPSLEAGSEEPIDSQVLPEDIQDTQMPADDIFEQSPDDDSIPAWMKDAGWEASSEAEEDVSVSISKNDDEESSPDDLVPADLPEWVQAIAPSEDALKNEQYTDEERLEVESESPPVETSALPWLEETLPSSTDTVATWLEEKEPHIPEDAQLDLETGEPIEIPDWLRDLKQDEIPPVPGEYTPDQEIEESLGEGTLEQVAEEGSGSELEKPVRRIALGAAAGILAATHDEDEPTDRDMDEALPESEAEVSDYIEATESIELEDQPLVVTETDDILPEWLKEPEAEPSSDQPELLHPEDQIEPSEEVDEVEIEDTGDQVTDEPEVPVTETTPQFETEDVAPKEDMLVADSEIEGEFPPASPEETLETQIPQDLDEIASGSDDLTPSLAPEGEPPATLEDDEAFAWLEGLAAKQGVDEAMLLSSDEHKDEPPDWVQADAIELSVESAEEADHVENEVDLPESIAPESEDTAEELPEWLMGIQPSDEDVAEPSLAESSEIPDWLKQAEIASSETVRPDGEEVDSQQEAVSAEEIPDWLKSTSAIAGVASVAAIVDEDARSDAA
ncbi:MAG: tetratricopeptide repeat protein, partial [bacterium]